MFGASVWYPLVRTRTHKASFGSNDKIFWIGIEGFCNEVLTHLWSIGISSIDQVDAQFKGAAQDCDGFLLVCRWSPDALTGEAQCTEAQTVDLEVSTNGKYPASFRWSLSCILHCRFLSSLIRSCCFKQPLGVSHSVKSVYPSMGNDKSTKIFSSGSLV